MSKIKLKTIFGPEEDFSVPVTVKNLNGSEVEVTFTCKARTLTEWAPLRKEIAAAALEPIRKQAEEAKAAAKKAKKNAGDSSDDQADEVSQWDNVLDNIKKFDDADPVDLTKVGIAKQAEFGMQIAAGWDIDDPLNAETLATFEDKFPGGIQILIDKYDAAIKGAREKN